MDGQLTEEEKGDRNKRLLAVVDRIAIEKHAVLVGTTQQILCEGPSKNNADKLSGRTPHNKIVIFEGNAERFTGQMLDMKIEQSTGFTLYGSVI